MIKRVGIVGGGVSGMLTAVNLCRKSTILLEIKIIHTEGVLGRGVAYSPYSESHLLNVMAGKMSLFPDQPDHFIDWVKQHTQYSYYEKEFISKTYLPRRLYGDYVQYAWDEIMQNKPAQVQVTVVNDTVTDIEIHDSVTLVLAGQAPVTVDYIVLATGNFLPANPALSNDAIFKSPCYFRNPWTKNSVTQCEPEKDILIIGNGLTMVDTVIGLREHGFSKRIYALSSTGFSVLPHRHNGIRYDHLIDELKKPYRLQELVPLFKKHINRLRKVGLSAEPVVDSVRMHTQEIWEALSLDEKKKFMNRLRHLWGVARHRLPVQVHDLIQHLKIEGKLVILSGKVIDMKEENNEVVVTYRERRSREEKILVVQRVINCTGPQQDVSKNESKLFDNLLRKGIVVPDELRQGINADTNDLRIITAEGKKLDTIFATGNLLKGVMWESTAVPELRIQANRIAEEILS